MKYRCSFQDCDDLATAFFQYVNKSSGKRYYFITCPECRESYISNCGAMSAYEKISKEEYTVSRVMDA
jgi:hypothetical protein